MALLVKKYLTVPNAVPTKLPDQFYASRAGRIITVTPTDDPTPTTRKAGRVSAVDYSFDVAVDLGEPQPVRVAVISEALTAIQPWSAKPENLGVIGRGADANELAIDFCIARILEAIDQGINFDQDFARFPESFLVIRELPQTINRIATVQMDEDIKDYISRRLYAARGACREMYHPEQCAQFFERPDWFYLKVGQPDFLRVIREYMDDLWKKPLREEQLYLLWTDTLVREMREAERVAVKATSPNPQANRLPLSPLVSPGGNELQPSAHPTRERVLGARINRWLEQEAARRGRLWGVIGFIVIVVLAALAI